MLDHNAWLRITSAALQLRDNRAKDVFDDAAKYNYGILTEKHKERLNKIEADYKDTILGAWNQHKIWLAFEKASYTTPNEVSRLEKNPGTLTDR